MSAFERVLQRATGALGPRAGYARDVLEGRQSWSGADLKGKAKRYGGGYARQRGHAARAWQAAGGVIVALRRSGKLVSAVPVGMDDYGTALYLRRSGEVVSALELRA